MNIVISKMWNKYGYVITLADFKGSSPAKKFQAADASRKKKLEICCTSFHNILKIASNETTTPT